jgi:RNA polymerase sigma factor (sigma-70 family)
MNERELLAARFEEHRPRLRALAYRMLGSLAEADDAVQDAWLRVGRADAGEIDNLGGWLTTTVARLCLNVLQARRVRARQASEPSRMPDPIVTPDAGLDPEHELLLADAVGLALQIVLETLPAPERLAFVLHDMFDMPFDDVAAIVGRSPAATRQLASRARRRVQGAAVPTPEAEQAARTASILRWFALQYADVGGVTLERAAALEEAASKRVSARLEAEVRSPSVGRCKQCGQSCAPWFALCERCYGRR